MTVLQEIEDLRQKLRYYSDKYYNDDAPEIEDYQYDMMMRRLESLEQANPRYVSPDSPTQKVGGKADNSFAPVAHTVRMESLQDAFSTAELRDFDRRVQGSVDHPRYVVEPKIDGLSVSLEYRDGVFVRGSTRGDGDVGEDVSGNLRVIRSIPLKIKDPLPYLEVRGEVYMPHRSFEQVVDRQQIAGEKPFKNPRNAAAGSLRQKDSSVTATRGLDIFVFNIQQIQGKTLHSHKESLDYLKYLGFHTVDDFPCYADFDKVLDEIKAIKGHCDGRLLKVIIETCLLTEAEKIELCRVVSESGADYIKTSTGFGGGGATREDVALFKAHVAPHVKIKAAGGIADLNDAKDFIALGADRLGTSRIVKAVKAMEQ